MSVLDTMIDMKWRFEITQNSTCGKQKSKLLPFEDASVCCFMLVRLIQISGVLGQTLDFLFHISDMFVSAFCLDCEFANDGSMAAAEVFKGVCKCLSVSVSLI